MITRFNRRDSIKIAGAGGTGSYLVPSLCRYLKENRMNTSIELIDYDRVEEKNIPRQNFAPCDVGEFKVVALANRYTSAYGVDIKPYPCRLEDVFLGDTDSGFTIGCVDNNAARTRMYDVTKNIRGTYIDAGNALKDGQVCLNRGKINMYDAHPELKKEEEAISCADVADQCSLVNQMAALAIMLMVRDYAENNSLMKCKEIRFNIAGQMNRIMIDDYGKQMTTSNPRPAVLTTQPPDEFIRLERVDHRPERIMTADEVEVPF